MAGVLGEGFRYLLITSFSATLSLGIPFILHEGFFVNPSIAVAIGFATVFIANFVSVKLYVFRNKRSFKNQLWRFTFISFVFRLSEYVAFLLVTRLLGVQYLAALSIVLIVSLALKFISHKRFVFVKQA